MQNLFWISFLMIFEKQKFGGRVIDIGLEIVAVAAGRVVGGPPRYSNKGGKKRRCVYNVCENHYFLHF